METITVTKAVADYSETLVQTTEEAVCLEEASRTEARASKAVDFSVRFFFYNHLQAIFLLFGGD